MCNFNGVYLSIDNNRRGKIRDWKRKSRDISQYTFYIDTVRVLVRWSGVLRIFWGVCVGNQTIQRGNLLRLHMVYRKVRSLVAVSSEVEIEQDKACSAP